MRGDSWKRIHYMIIWKCKRYIVVSVKIIFRCKPGYEPVFEKLCKEVVQRADEGDSRKQQTKCSL
ncbi:hypothetical protein PAECIP111892_03454 [Paenibacillus auburnensis]|uniref:Uncharacterized protein n=1 Tax=Paenibacillus auburnensis TaxID=2905649 RepID=A0ABN8GNT8_9BACL|nr:hypothetical protein PAECIP111892_03454 [Paenibacillus auburnensis]